MIIHFTSERGIYKCPQDFVRAVPIFSELLDNLGVNYLAYVAYLTDPAEDNLYYTLPEPIRDKKLIDNLKLDKEKLKDKLVKEALKEYKTFVRENIGYQFKDSYLGGLQKVAEYVNGKKKINDEDSKAFIAALGEMPKLLKGKSEVEKMSTKEEQKKGVVRGKKELTLNEQG